MLMGQLKSFSLESLLQICYNESNTGAIEFWKHDMVYGQIGFEKGSVMYADFLGMKGDGAVKQISLLSDIDFKYNESTQPRERNIKMDINFLTIECSRYKDECSEYLAQLSESISANYSIKRVSFYDYESPFFCFPEKYDIRYFESFIDDEVTVVYWDKNINARIQIIFSDHIISDSLLMFMEDKDMLR
ncbi:MAG: DUF4388 domain-containing protein [Pseudomonadota bacterium]